jgi:carbon-monoxide dehydrogenase large subunit
VNKPNTFIGAPIERVEDLRLLRGKGIFVDDVEREDMLYAVMVRSSVAHGHLRSVDASEALRLPGVVAVITARDIGMPLPMIPLRNLSMPQLEPYEQPVIAGDKVRYVGEPVAVVVAETQEIAEDALDHIHVEIDALPPIVSCREFEPPKALLVEQSGTNKSVTYASEKGNARQEFPGCYKRRERFQTNRHTAAPMELRGLLAEWDDQNGRLIVHGAAKVPFITRRILAKLIGMPIEAIDMIEVDVGGGFGMRGEFFPEDFLVPFAARHVKRPVKWNEDFREHLMASNHSREYDADIEIVCEQDGTIVALRGEVFADVGAYLRSTANVGPRNIGQFMSGPYRVPNIYIESSMMVTNKTPTGTYRGPGRFEGDYMRERLFDLAAQDLGIDRVEFRRHNLASREEMPYPLATLTPLKRVEELDSGDNLETLERCLHEFGWDEKSKRQGLQDDGRYWGVGIGCFVEGGGSGPREHARIAVQTDGTISVYVGGALVGQGIETVMSQIAADCLGVDMASIRSFHGSTIYLPDGYGASHSRGTVMAGSAVHLAAEELKNTIRSEAARRLNCAAAEVVLRDTVAYGPNDTSVRWADLAGDGLQSHAAYEFKKHTYAYGAQAVQVAVNAHTGHIEIVDYVCAEDVGRIVNPLTMKGQVIGAMVQGLGGVLLEHLRYDESGQLLVGSLADYVTPSATDFPVLRAYVTGKHPSPNNPLGVKGAGEGGLIVTAGVVANAVASALGEFGVSTNSLPLTPHRVWQLIHERRS